MCFLEVCFPYSLKPFLTQHHSDPLIIFCLTCNSGSLPACMPAPKPPCCESPQPLGNPLPSPHAPPPTPQALNLGSALKTDSTQGMGGVSVRCTEPRAAASAQPCVHYHRRGEGPRNQHRGQEGLAGYRIFCPTGPRYLLDRSAP